MNRKIIPLVSLLFVVAALAVLRGAVGIPLKEILLADNRPILQLRLLRIILATVSGAGLSVCGIVLQAILRNSLAEPYLLGTSSGAGLGAVIALVLGLSWAYLPLFAFIGAILAVVVVYSLARQNNRLMQQSLILSGVIVSVALSAIIVFLVSVSGNQTLHELTWWLWGSLQVMDPKLLFFVTIIVLVGISIVYLFAQDLNAISIGEEEAIHLGIDIEKVKKILIIVTSFMAASLVCVSGIIGFVGLMIPHMMRLMVGPNHKVLIPVSCISGAIFMIACDLLSRTVFPPLEIPIGVVTALLGAPVFIFLLKRSQRI